MVQSSVAAEAHRHVMPRPTIWPAVLGAGLTLLPAGLVLGLVTAITGLALTVVAVAGWVHELLVEFPADGVEEVGRDDARSE